MDSKVKNSELLLWKNNNWGLGCNKSGYTSPRINSQVADCACPFVFDQYTFCSHGCAYCFASPSKLTSPVYMNFKRDDTGKLSMTPRFTGSPLRSIDPVLFQKMIEGRFGKGGRGSSAAFSETLFKDRFVLHWGSMTDPFCAYERENRVGLKILEILAKNSYPTLIGFKGRTILEKPYMDLLEKHAHQKNFAFQISITTADSKLASWLEVGVPTPTKRFEIMKMLSDMGYYTILRVRPFLPGITDRTLDDILERGRDAGARSVTTEFFCVDSRWFPASGGVLKEMTNRMQRVAELMGFGPKTLKRLYDYFPELRGKILTESDILRYWFKALSPRQRGTYYRLNLDLKVPHVLKMYKFCLENNMTFNISDPDFKHINQSLCCCGLPDVYEANPEMTHFQHRQQTTMIVEMRREYWKRRKIGELNPVVLRTFRQVYCKGDQPTGLDFLYDHRLIDQHIRVIRDDISSRRTKSLIDYIRLEWNNPRSYASPYYYFYGRVAPHAVDAAGDTVFKYEPAIFEEQWVDNGIDLSKG